MNPLSPADLRRLRTKRITIVAIAALMFTTSTASAQILYTVHDLGFPPGWIESLGFAINNSGQVTGMANPNAGEFAFRTMPGGSFADPGANISGGYPSSGRAINASGQVTGGAFGNGYGFAFRTAPNGSINAGGNLGFPAGGTESYGTGINDLGQVVGNWSMPGALSRAFRTTPTGLASDPGTDLGTLGGTRADAAAINNSGMVTGYSNISGNTDFRAFRTAPNGLISDPGTNLGVFPGGTQSFGLAINDLGQVTGRATIANGDTHAFRTSSTGLVSDPGTDLGVLPGFQRSVGNDINNSGVVVGVLGPTNSVTNRAFIYDTEMRNLNDLISPSSGWVLLNARSINDQGWITGYGLFNGGTVYRGFVLTPVPEPSSIALVGSVLVVGMFVRRRRLR